MGGQLNGDDRGAGGGGPSSGRSGVGSGQFEHIVTAVPGLGHRARVVLYTM